MDVRAYRRNYFRQWRRDERMKLTAAGVCIECRKEPPAIGRSGRTVQRCEGCNERMIEQAMERKRRRRGREV